MNLVAAVVFVFVVVPMILNGIPGEDRGGDAAAAIRNTGRGGARAAGADAIAAVTLTPDAADDGER